MVVSEEMAAKLEPGDELFAYYGYKSDSPFPEDFPWYFELKAKSDKEEREKEEAKKEKPRKRGKKTTNKKEPVS